MGSRNSKKTYDIIAMLGAIVMGILFFVIVQLSFKHIKSSCDNKPLRICLTIILALSASLSTAAIAYLFCNAKSGSCYDEHRDQNTAAVYFIIGGIINFGILVCLSIALREVDKSGDECGGKKVKLYLIALTVISSILLVSMILGIVFAKVGLSAKEKALLGT